MTTLQKRNLTHFLLGALFAGGLAIAGMLEPKTILGFLDFTGNWDPTMIWVLLSGVGVNLLIFQRVIRRRRRPVLAPTFEIPTKRVIDRRLVVGATLFGAGWGLAGICPGPGIASLVTGSSDALIFVSAMGMGMALFSLYERLRRPHAPVHGGLVATLPTQPTGS